MEESLPKLELWERFVAVGGSVLLALLTWVIGRKVGKWLEGSTRLGIKGLERLAAPITLLIWLLVGWLTLEGARKATSSLEWLIEISVIVAGFWLAGRGLDVAWETGRASARLRSQPSATAAVLASRLLGKVVLLVIAVTAIAVRLGATEQLYLALGAIGAALAFAARVPIANIFSFVQMTLDPPFRMGDRVRIGDFRGGDPVEGEVVGISLSTVKVRARRRTEIAISNSLLGSLRVENLSASDRRRLVLAFPIGLGVPAESLRHACEAIEKDLLRNEWVTDVRPPHVWISGYNGGLQLKVSVWLKRGSGRREAQRDLFLLIRTRFEEVVSEESE